MDVLKSKDAWMEVILIDPIALPISKVLIKKKINPLIITLFSFLFRVSAGISFFLGYFLISALLAYIGLLLDGMDGKVARGLDKFTIKQGTLDFVLDQIAFVIIIFFMFLHFSIINIDILNMISIFTWISFYFILMSLTSTKHRLLVEKNVGSMKLETHRDIYDQSLKESSKIMKLVKSSYIKLEKITEKLRMTPLPSTIEAEVLLFLIAPIFINYFAYFSFIGSLCFLPDILSHVYTCYLLLNYEKK